MTEAIIIPDGPVVVPSSAKLGRGRGRETIVVVRKNQGTRLKPASGVEQRFEIKKCIVLPRVARETEGGYVQIAGYTVFAPPNADVNEDDRVICRGILHSVKGVPGDLRNARGKQKVLAITLERVTK